MHRCPAPGCGIPGAFIGAIWVQCPNPACQNYEERRLNEVKQNVALFQRVCVWAWRRHVEASKK